MTTITFTGVDPTAFNALSTAFYLGGKLVLAVALSQLYALIVTWQLRSRRRPCSCSSSSKSKSQRTLPATEIGNKPGDSFAAARLAWALQCSMPALVLLGLFLAADFSEVVADLGLQFVTVATSGPADTVLDLSRRNPWRLIETAGDPSFNSRAIYASTAQIEKDLEGGRRNLALKSAFLEAMDLIARGGSPFVDEPPTPTGGSAPPVVNQWEGSAALVVYRSDDTPITSMDLEIPLNCSGPELVEMEQNQIVSPAFIFENFAQGYEQYYNRSQNVERKTLSRVPDCEFASRRETGIFMGGGGSNRSRRRTASIHEYATLNDNDRVFLAKDGNALPKQASTANPVFTLTPEWKRLARDREDWRTGRTIDGAFNGVFIGDTTYLPLGRVVLATGPEAVAGPIDVPINSDNDSDGGGVDFSRTNNYGIVGEILGNECPRRPSGLPATGAGGCFVVLLAACPTFREDFQSFPLVDSELGDTDCQINYVSVVWGKGFRADAELVSTMAGIYGRTQPASSFAFLEFHFFAPFAAMFATASLSVRPTVVEQVSPRINGVYIFFILLPYSLALTLMLLVWSFRRDCLPVPQTPWELLVLGREGGDMIRTRESGNDQFPEPDRALALALIREEGTDTGRLALVSGHKTSSPDSETDTRSRGNYDDEQEVEITPPDEQNGATRQFLP